MMTLDIFSIAGVSQDSCKLPRWMDLEVKAVLVTHADP